MLQKVKVDQQVYIWDDSRKQGVFATVNKVGRKYLHLSTHEQADKVTGMIAYQRRCYPTEYEYQEAERLEVERRGFIAGARLTGLRHCTLEQILKAREILGL